jgi:hypothetical protein
VSMRGGWTIAATPARPPYVFARGVSPLWLARVRRLLTEHSNEDGSSSMSSAVDAFSNGLSPNGNLYLKRSSPNGSSAHGGAASSSAATESAANGRALGARAWSRIEEWTLDTRKRRAALRSDPEGA